jgi:hypothetical protein
MSKITAVAEPVAPHDTFGNAAKERALKVVLTNRK